MIRAARTANRPVARASAKPKASLSAKRRSARRPPRSRRSRRPPPPAPAAAAPGRGHRPARVGQGLLDRQGPVGHRQLVIDADRTTLSCNVSDGMLPDNVTAIVSFLLAHGYTDNAAAGIAGNMYQESKGNPESEGMGGGGLIGFTPLPAGYVTGNPAADLQTQLEAVLTYNQQWAGYLPELNAAASPADAAYVYVTDFERAGIPAASTREASAEDVAAACGI